MTSATELCMRAAAILTALLTATGVVAGDTTQAVRAVTGSWRLSEVGGKVGCTLNLTDTSALGGLAVKVPPACRLAFPPIKDLSAWSVDEKESTVLFSDPSRRRIVQFQSKAGGTWEGQGPDGATWRLERAAPTKTEPMPPIVGGPGR